MANETLADELLTMIKSETVNNPAPQKCRITKVYEDMHVDVESLQGLLKYVQVFGTNVKKGDEGVLLFLNETYDDYVVLSGNGSSVTVDSELSSSSTNPVQNKVIKGALDDYVQKSNGANTMTDSSAYSTIGTSANATQKQINAKIDEKLDDIYDTFLCENLLFDESEYVG